MTLKRTPLFAAHQRAGGKLIEFGGWEMPVQYSTITDEHLCVRRAAGVFDISRLGRSSCVGRRRDSRQSSAKVLTQGRGVSPVR